MSVLADDDDDDDDDHKRRWCCSKVLSSLLSVHSAALDGKGEFVIGERV